MPAATLTLPALLPFAVDSVANVVDYGFHLYAGRTLPADGFAMMQAINGIMLIVITMCSVLQPVVARYVAEAGARRAGAGVSNAIFQSAWRYGVSGGVLLALATYVAREPAARLFNVAEAAISWSAVLVLLAVLRPVVGGMLQGQQRFVALSVNRALHAIVRFCAGVLLIALGRGALGAVAALPVASFLALLAGMALLGRSVWQTAPPPPESFLSGVLHLSAAGLVSYASYMILLNSDLVWVNRALPGDLAGGYAAAALLRRILAVLPSTAIGIMYPRAVARIAQGQSPDEPLLWAGAIALGSGAALTALYTLLGRQITLVAFGPAYSWVAPWIGWMGLAAVGYSVALIWLNLYLAVQPGPFTLILAATALLQNGLLARYHATPQEMIAIFAVCGWLLAVAGGLLYLLWLRPRLSASPTLSAMGGTPP